MGLVKILRWSLTSTPTTSVSLSSASKVEACSQGHYSRGPAVNSGGFAPAELRISIAIFGLLGNKVCGGQGGSRHRGFSALRGTRALCLPATCTFRQVALGFAHKFCVTKTRSHGKEANGGKLVRFYTVHVRCEPGWFGSRSHVSEMQVSGGEWMRAAKLQTLVTKRSGYFAK